MGIPGMMLPRQTSPYQDDVGAKPMDLMTLISTLSNPSLNNSQTMGNSNFQTPQGDLSVGGDPSTLSGRIQEFLGAKQPNQGGQIQDILAGRFQQPTPTFSDIGNSAIQTLQGGQYVPAQNVANQRLSSSMDALSKISSLQEQQARGNYYNAQAKIGGTTAFAQTMAQINSDPTLSGLSQMEKIRIAQNKVGTNLTVGPDGQVSDMGGAAQSLGNLKAGETQGQKNVELTMNPQIAGASKTAELGAQRTFEQPKAISALAENSANTQNVLSKINEALPQVGNFTAGIGSVTAAIPGTPAADLDANLKTIGSNLGFQKLQAMRAASPTGSALARVTQQEILMLQQTMNNISQSQSPGQLKANLINLKSQLADQDSRIKAAYKLTYPNGEGTNIPAQNDANKNINSGGGVVHFNDLPQ